MLQGSHLRKHKIRNRWIEYFQSVLNEPEPTSHLNVIIHVTHSSMNKYDMASSTGIDFRCLVWRKAYDWIISILHTLFEAKAEFLDIFCVVYAKSLWFRWNASLVFLCTCPCDALLILRGSCTALFLYSIWACCSFSKCLLVCPVLDLTDVSDVRCLLYCLIMNWLSLTFPFLIVLPYCCKFGVIYTSLQAVSF